MEQKVVMVLKKVMVLLEMVAMVDPRSVILNVFYVDKTIGPLSYTKTRELIPNLTVMVLLFNESVLKLLKRKMT